MKSLVKGVCILISATAASAHYYKRHSTEGKHHTGETLLNETETHDTTSSTTATPTTASALVSPVLKDISEKAHLLQIKDVVSTFEKLLINGDMQPLAVTPSKLSEGAKDSAYNAYSKYNDEKDCVNCVDEKKYRDFDYQFKTKGDDSNTCYALRRSDEGYNKCDFEDISSTGTLLTNFTSGATTVQVDTCFPFYDRHLDRPVMRIFQDGFVSFSVSDPLPTKGNTLPNPSVGPYDVIAAFYQTQRTAGNGLANPAIYVLTDEDKTIVQWEMNEQPASGYAQSSDGAAVYQMQIEKSGRIAFSYKLIACDIPAFTTVQVGVKPLETELQEGYKTSYFQSACQDGGYYAPCPGMSVVLERVKCNSLLGQTGIQKPYINKKEYKSYKNDYESKKDYYTQQFHSFTKDFFEYYC